MGDIPTSAFDPIFFLHHCNIDRLWEKWLSQGGSRTNPVTDLDWMYNTVHTFVDENKKPVKKSASDVLYTVTQLHYYYDDLACFPYQVAQGPSQEILPPPPSARSRLVASLVLARNVKPQPHQMRLELRTGGGEIRERLARMLSVDTLTKTVESGARYFLVFEGMQTDAPLNGNLAIFLGLPADSRPVGTSRHYVGRLSFFGASAESRRAMHGTPAGHADAEMTVHRDVTDTLKRLVERGEISRNELSVTLVPVGVRPAPDRPFTLDARANPRIETIVLTIERNE